MNYSVGDAHKPQYLMGEKIKENFRLSLDNLMQVV